MSDDQQPRAEWIFPEQKKRYWGRIWLIIGLVLFTVLIMGGLLFFLIPRGGGEPAPSPSATESTTSPTPTATSAPTSPVPSPTEDSEPEATPPAPPDPDLATFTSQVQPRLDVAVNGLDLIRQNIDLGAEIVDSLQQDANILSDTPAPGSIADAWSTKVAEYATRLAELRATYDDGSDHQSAVDAAAAALQEVRALVGL